MTSDDAGPGGPLRDPLGRAAQPQAQRGAANAGARAQLHRRPACRTSRQAIRAKATGSTELRDPHLHAQRDDAAGLALELHQFQRAAEEHAR